MYHVITLLPISFVPSSDYWVIIKLEVTGFCQSKILVSRDSDLNYYRLTYWRLLILSFWIIDNIWSTPNNKMSLNISNIKCYTSKIIRNITIEPIFFLFSLCLGFYIIVASELYISKVCNVNLNYTREICDNIQVS